MNKKLLSVAIAAALGLAGCGGGSSTSSTNDTSQNDSSNNTQQNDDGEIISALSEGFALPTELSAVPADSDNSAQAALAAGLGPRLRALSRAVAVDELPADSDYAKAQPKKYIEERALEQFEVIEQVLNAVGQTHYADAGNVNEGPYTAMVTWVDDQDGRQVKTLQPWVVDSRMIVIDGQDVNRVLAWIEEPSEEVPGTTELIKAEFKIYKAATVAADGAFIDYGDWDLNVSFGEDSSGTVTDYFAATSRVSDGVTTIKIHESFPDGPPGAGGEAATYELKGILVRSATSGYGKVAFPDWESCFGPDAGADCTPDTKEVAYAYNAAFLGVDDDPATEGAVYKDRDPANAVEFTHRYGLFYANADSDNSIGAGDNVERHKAFGFPIRYTDDHGLTRYAYYGAWQGRHEIWGGERDGVAAGTEVTRDDRGPNQTAETYTVSDKFNGTLTKRTLVDGSLSDIQGIVVETWINKHWDLMWDQSANNGDGAWMYCDGWTEWGFDDQTQQDTLTCHNRGDAPGSEGIPFTAFDDFSLLESDDSGRKFVNVGYWDEQNQEAVNLAYNPDGASGAGFYIAQEVQGESGPQLQVSDTMFTPQDGANIWVDIGGSIYIQYTGEFNGPTTTTGWVQKILTGFDEDTWTPTFAENDDDPFSPEVGRDYYINNNGANFVVKRKASADAADSYEVYIELQSAANPVNIADFLPPGTSYLRTPWRPDVKFTFVTDSSDDNYLKLIYASDDPATQDVDESTTPTVYTSGEWGLQAYNSGDQPLAADGTAIDVDEFGFPTDPDMRPMEFNWEYSQDGWGTQQFLVKTDGSGEYVLLSNPIQLNPVTLTNKGGDEKTLSLQYDGWMHGLPDLYWELSKNGWQMSQEIADKVISIPAGTLMTGTDGTEYYVKPMEVSVFLDVLTDEEAAAETGLPDLDQTSSVDLDTVPDFTPHGMGAKPTGTEVKYSEGKPVS